MPPERERETRKRRQPRNEPMESQLLVVEKDKAIKGNEGGQRAGRKIEAAN